MRTLVMLGLAAAPFAAARGAVATAPDSIPALPAHPARPVTFSRDVAPILQRRCVSCHGESEAQAGLRLDSLAGVMRGGDAGPVVIAGNPDDSLLLAKIERRHRPSMPPRRRLPAPAIAAIRDWIAGGAPP